MLHSRIKQDPNYGMPRDPKVGGSEFPNRAHDEYIPQYIQGSDPIHEGNIDFSGLYTKEDIELVTNEEVTRRNYSTPR